MIDHVQRQPAELLYQQELDFLRNEDTHTVPEGWGLSPRMVRAFILGETVAGKPIKRKIWGNDDIVEKSIVTLIGQRGLLLVGEPGTAKSLLSELLAAAISGNSKLTVQGSAGIVEENIRYSWNYALLLKNGPELPSLIPGPLLEAMRKGAIMRFEELTRCPTEVQDNLIPVLSDKILHIPEIKDETQSYLLSKPGFNIIGTANLKDRGVNELSSALKRRFNFVTMKPLQSLDDQKALIQMEVNAQLAEKGIRLSLEDNVAELLVTAFKELRAGNVEGQAIDRPSTILSVAEAVGVAYSASVHAHYFGEQTVRPQDIASHMIGTVIKDNEEDVKRFKDYLKIIARKRKDKIWQDFSSHG